MTDFHKNLGANFTWECTHHKRDLWECLSQLGRIFRVDQYFFIFFFVHRYFYDDSEAIALFQKLDSRKSPSSLEKNRKNLANIVIMISVVLLKLLLENFII